MCAPEGQRPASGAKGEEKEPGHGPLRCAVAGSPRGAAGEWQLQRCLSRAAAVWLGQMQTAVGRDRNENVKRISEKGGGACRIKWGFVSFGSVCSVHSPPRRFGSKVLVTLVYISLGPFEARHAPNNIENECGVEHKCISRDRRVTRICLAWSKGYP